MSFLDSLIGDFVIYLSGTLNMSSHIIDHTTDSERECY